MRVNRRESESIKSLKQHQKGTLQPASRQHLSALHAITTTVSESLDLETVLQGVIKEITAIFKFDTTRIFLFNPQMSEIHLRASYETKRENFAPNTVFRRGQGNVGRVADTGQPLIYEDIRHNRRYQRLSATKSTKQAGFSFLAAFPIKTKLTTVGTILCIGIKPRRLRASEIQLITSMANQIAIAVEYAKLFEEAQGKAKELSALYSVADIVSQSLEIDSILSNIMHTVLKIFRFDAGRIYVRHSDSEELRLITYEGFPKGIHPRTSYQIGEHPIGRIYQRKKPLIFEDMRTDPGYQRITGRNLMVKAGFRASFFVPIQVREKSVGIMQILSKAVHRFSQSEQKVINAVAHHLGIALGNASLYDQVKQKTAELEKANKGKSEFLGVMSHELRTPLNAIAGYSALIKDRIMGDINQQQERAVDKITRNSKELLTMINGILQATSIEAEAVEAEIEEFDVVDFLDDLRATFDVHPRKELDLIWDYPSDLPALITDRGKLRYVLQNLITNAIKYTDQGRVVVSARRPVKAETLEFEVADTGIGIRKELLPSIFEMFRQDDGPDTRRSGGVGLGLFIAKKFADLIGATIEVESEIGKGSTFTVTLPLTNESGSNTVSPLLSSQEKSSNIT